MLPLIQQVATEYKHSLHQIYGSDLIEVILYGSYARGNYHNESDIDFAVVLSDAHERTAMDMDKTSRIDSMLSLKYGIMLSSLLTSYSKKQTSMQGIYQNIKKEGIVI